MSFQRSSQQYQRSAPHARTSTRRSGQNGIRRIANAAATCTMLALSATFISVESWSINRLATKRPASASFSARPRIGKRERVKSILNRVLPFQLTSSDDVNGSDATVLKAENKLLREVIGELEEENARLKQKAGRIVLETFEGERFFKDGSETSPSSSISENEGLTLTGEELLQDELWCDELEGGKDSVMAICTLRADNCRRRKLGNGLLSHLQFVFETYVVFRSMSYRTTNIIWSSSSR